MLRQNISLPEARRIALAAQGFDRARPKRPANAADITRVIDRLGVLQLDFVNVLVPAHHFVVYSRLGAYDRDKFHRLIYSGRNFTEHWAHEASIVPTALWPALQYRRDDYEPYPNSPITKLRNSAKYIEQVYDLINELAPLTSADLPQVAGPARKPGDWHRSLPRWALEYHFGKGTVAVANRRPNFQRVYDLSERLIDAEHRAKKLSRPAAQRELLGIAARAFGVATADDLADYYRMSSKEALTRIEELVEIGSLQKVSVRGWDKPAFLSSNAKCPRKIRAASLLSPFDPTVWYRPRAQRLFDFHYRIEIYVPANKRKWGYYVLPFLMDDRIVARVDLKADRGNRTLLILAAHSEEKIDERRVIRKLASELWSLANWLELHKMKVSRRGQFARGLADFVRDNPGLG